MVSYIATNFIAFDANLTWILDVVRSIKILDSSSTNVISPNTSIATVKMVVF